MITHHVSPLSASAPRNSDIAHIPCILNRIYNRLAILQCVPQLFSDISHIPSPKSVLTDSTISNTLRTVPVPLLLHFKSALFVFTSTQMPQQSTVHM